MSVPTLTAVLDKSAYAPGETIRLTLTATDADRGTLSVTATYTDSTGNTSTVTASAAIDQGTFAVSSVPARTWTKASETAGTAVFTATA